MTTKAIQLLDAIVGGHCVLNPECVQLIAYIDELERKAHAWDGWETHINQFKDLPNSAVDPSDQR